jgi:hypothetical protein
MSATREGAAVWGFASNRHLYEFMQDHSADWNKREDFVREMDPVIRNTIVERKKYEKKREEIVDYFSEVTRRREDVSTREKTTWDEDVERDEGKIWHKIR